MSETDTDSGSGPQRSSQEAEAEFENDMADLVESWLVDIAADRLSAFSEKRVRAAAESHRHAVASARADGALEVWRTVLRLRESGTPLAGIASIARQQAEEFERRAKATDILLDKSPE